MKAHLALPTLLAMALGCSRQQTEAPAAPTLQAPTASMSAGIATPPSPAASAAASSSRSGDDLEGRTIRLRHDGPWSPEPESPAVELRPGSPPDAAHPDGTAIVVELADDDAVSVTEWDLATKTALHQTEMALPAWDLRVLEGPGPIRVLAAGYNGPLHFVQLTSSLQVVTKAQIGSLSVLGVHGFAGDPSLTVILANGYMDGADGPKDPSGTFAMSFDAAGHRLAKRILLPYQEHRGTLSPMMHQNLAVLDGHAYVALLDESDGLHVLRLTRDLRTDRDRLLRLPKAYSNIQASLQALDGHLVLDLPDQPDLLDLPLDLDLSHATHRPRPAPPPALPGGGDLCGPPLRLASELLALCSCGKQMCLSWAPAPR
jgi:hypothetical protein